MLERASVLNCWVSWPLSWRDLQPRGPRQSPNWDELGPLKAAVQTIESTQNTTQQPVRLLVELGEAPSWAHQGVKGCDRNLDCGPDANHVGAYARIVSQVAKQMRAILLGPNCLEVMGWYQPNSRDHFWPDPQPHVYARMMRAAYPALKRMKVPFILGDLVAPTAHAHITAPDKFLRSVYADTGGRFWDLVGVDTGNAGWLWPEAVHNVARDRVVVAALDVSPGDAEYIASLLQDARDMHWLVSILVKVPSGPISAQLVQQVQQVQQASERSP